MHRYTQGDHIILGGVKVPHTHAIDAHSDGDVVLHAVTDALLGALGLGDIGEWFPDSDPELADIDSKNLITPIIMCMRDHGFELNNLDITIIAQAPKVVDYKELIQKSISQVFSCEHELINVKATTPEHMGALGRKEGIQAHAVLSLIGKQDDVERTGNQFVLVPEELDISNTNVQEIIIDTEIELDGEDI